VGSWRGTTNCGGGPEEDVFSITKSSTTANRIIIEGGVYGELTSSNTFDIPTQTVNGNGTAATINGRGNLNGNQLTLTYVLTIEGAAITCTGTYNKQ
jgi:cytoskeletal protein CcmA (bactofilin family)